VHITHILLVLHNFVYIECFVNYCRAKDAWPSSVGTAIDLRC